MYFPAHAQWTTNDLHEAEWSSAPVRQECCPRTGKVRYLFAVFSYFKLYFIQTIEVIYGRGYPFITLANFCTFSVPPVHPPSTVCKHEYCIKSQTFWPSLIQVAFLKVLNAQDSNTYFFIKALIANMVGLFMVQTESLFTLICTSSMLGVNWPWINKSWIRYALRNIFRFHMLSFSWLSILLS